MGADPASLCGHIVLLNKRVFLWGEAQNGRLNEGRPGALPLEIVYRKKTFSRFLTAKKFPSNFSKKNPKLKVSI